MNLRNEILKLIAFHDVFEFPLTGEEVFQFIEHGTWSMEQAPSMTPRDLGEEKGGVILREIHHGKIGLRSVLQELEEMVVKGVLEKEEVFYCLAGRKEIIKQRKIRYPISLQKLTKSRKWIRIFSLFPFIRVVNIAGTVADQNARRESDIDLAVETARGRVWTARFFLNASLSVLRKRPRPGRTRDTFCTSFFYDEAFEPKTIMPADLLYQAWARGWHWMSSIKYPLRQSGSEAAPVSSIQGIVEFFVEIIPEHVYRWIQIHLLMPRELRLANQKDGRMDVFFNKKVIKLHLNNRREFFEKRYGENTSKLNLTF